MEIIGLLSGFSCIGGSQGWSGVQKISNWLGHYGNSDPWPPAFLPGQQVCNSCPYVYWSLKHHISRGGFQILTSVLDPTFTLSSDFYYRGLLAKVKKMSFLVFLAFLCRYMTRARQGSRNTSRMKSQSLLALPWMDGPFIIMDTWVLLQVKMFTKI